MKVHFLDDALADLEETVTHYNSRSEGLGFEFLAEARAAIQRIIEYPRAWSPLSRRTRCCRTHRFPYGVIYQERAEMILVVGVLHLHRDPRMWRDRLPPGQR